MGRSYSLRTGRRAQEKRAYAGVAESVSSCGSPSCLSSSLIKQAQGTLEEALIYKGTSLLFSKFRIGHMGSKG